jgi:hypothetical protein
MNNKDLTVINIFGGPGSGKSATASGLFHRMKVEGDSVELVTEYAKDLVWEERFKFMPDQDYVMAKQNRRLRRLVGKVKYAITDSPLLLSITYSPLTFPESFKTFCVDVFKSYNNISIYLKRFHGYQLDGRRQDEEQANVVSLSIQNMLNEYHVEHCALETNSTTVADIIAYLRSFRT